MLKSGLGVPKLKRLAFLMVLILCLVSGCAKTTEKPNFERPEELNDARYTVAAKVGAASEPYVAKVFPNAVEKQFAEINNMVIALEGGQVDAIVFTRAQLERILDEKPDTFRILDDPIGETDIHMVISTNTAVPNLERDVNAFLKAKQADGTLKKMHQYWIVEHNMKLPELPEPQNLTKKLVVGTLGTSIPLSFYADNELTGFDIELMKRFSSEYGYAIEYRVENMVSLLSDAEFGKIDLISGSVMYTKERAERVIFPETPLYSLPVSVMVRNEQRTATGFLATLEESFEKTLIREDRYKMILGGLKVTLILAVGSLICGTMLGFFFCLLKRSKNRLISTLMNAFIALMAGLPIVLTLMICFYIIFSGTGLNEIIVAIIAFSVDFGCYTAITLNSGIESVPHGEIEAAEALGLSKLQIYRRIILPQAIRKVFGVYTRQVVSLIKSTSIVGYIAVQDLTKVSDIIRARTYEAFFSLIFTAAIYFLIARICIYLLHSVEHAFNRRKSKQITL